MTRSRRRSISRARPPWRRPWRHSDTMRRPPRSASGASIRRPSARPGPAATRATPSTTRSGERVASRHGAPSMSFGARGPSVRTPTGASKRSSTGWNWAPPPPDARSRTPAVVYRVPERGSPHAVPNAAAMGEHPCRPRMDIRSVEDRTRLLEECFPCPCANRRTLKLERVRTAGGGTPPIWSFVLGQQRRGRKHMRATLMYGAGDVRVETVPDPVIKEPTDAIVRVLRACICGSDLWPYGSMPHTARGSRMGHEFIGIVEDLGGAVSGRITPATSVARACRRPAATAAGGAVRTWTAARARPCGCRRPRARW